MLKNYFTIAFRNLWRHRAFSAINLLGLAVGMSSFFLLYSYVSFERSFDAFNTKADRIYRMRCDTKTQTETIHTGTTCGPVSRDIQANFPQVENQTRLCFISYLVANGTKKFQEDNIVAADSTLFDIFSLPLTVGDPGHALKDPYSVVLSEAGALKYFGSADAVGRSLVLGDNHVFNVTGILKNIPANSQFHGDIFISMNTLTRGKLFGERWDKSYGNFNWFSYLLLKPGAEAQKLELSLRPFINEKAAEVTKATGMTYVYHLMPLKSVHLGPTLDNYGLGEPTGSLANTYIFSIIGAFLLIIACINFINLTTARAAERAREVGIRKAIGAMRNQLTLQFLGESILLCFFAYLLAIGLTNALDPLFNSLLNTNIPLDATGVNGYLLQLLVIATGIGAIAGIYPALVMSGFNPIAVLKGRFNATKNGLIMRQTLVVFQFTLSTALIIGTIVIYNQLRYMQNQDLGFKKDQVLAINYYGDSAVRVNVEHIRQEFNNIPGVKSVAFSMNVPGNSPNNWYSQIENNSGVLQGANFNFYVVDFDFFKHYGIKMATGRPFSNQYSIDSSHSLIINEAAARSLGYSDPAKAVGKKFEMWGDKGTIIGIAKDFHYRSLQEAIQPLAFRVLNPWFYSFISLNISADHIQKTVATIGEHWRQIAPQRPFQYTFVDEDFAKLYSSEDRFQRVFVYFGLLAIFISCLGLLGLAAYSTIQRTKEIGIRKVLGASVSTIVGLLSKEFLKLVFIALLIASPIAWFAMHSWLQDFAYRTAIAWWVFPLAAAAAVLITFLTVGFHSIKAAIADPVDSLRTE